MIKNLLELEQTKISKDIKDYDIFIYGESLNLHLIYMVGKGL